MSEFVAYPLASNAKSTRLSDLEENLRSGVEIVGGYCYSGGVSIGPMPGAIGKSQIKSARWIGNARKTEPYAWTILHGHIATAATGTTEIVIPGLAGIAAPEGVEFGIAYGSITGGASFSGSLSLNVTASTLTLTNLAALASAKSSSTHTWTTTTDDFIKATLVISTAAITINDAVITIAIKAKHVA